MRLCYLKGRSIWQKKNQKMTKLTSLGDAPAKQQDQPLSGAGESFIGKISGPIEKPVRRQKRAERKTRR